MHVVSKSMEMVAGITKDEHSNAGYDRNLWDAQAEEAHPRDNL